MYAVVQNSVTAAFSIFGNLLSLDVHDKRLFFFFKEIDECSFILTVHFYIHNSYSNTLNLYIPLSVQYCICSGGL